MRTRKGFTLVEILIVVVILGILAAIVIPQFTQASTEARISNLQSNLQSVRAQIELYKIQHNDNPPDDNTTLDAQLTDKTDIAGSTTGTDDFGPYLQKFPTNPFSGISEAAQVIGAAAAGSDWYYVNNGDGTYTFDVGVGTDTGASSTAYVGQY